MCAIRVNLYRPQFQPTRPFLNHLLQYLPSYLQDSLRILPRSLSQMDVSRPVARSAPAVTPPPTLRAVFIEPSSLLLQTTTKINDTTSWTARYVDDYPSPTTAWSIEFIDMITAVQYTIYRVNTPQNQTLTSLYTCNATSTVMTWCSSTRTFLDRRNGVLSTENSTHSFFKSEWGTLWGMTTLTNVSGEIGGRMSTVSPPPFSDTDVPPPRSTTRFSGTIFKQTIVSGC